MKLKIALAVFFTVSVWWGGQVYAQNLIKNGGFEDTDTACMNSYPAPQGSAGYGFGPIDCITPWGEYASTQLVFHHPDGIFKGASAAAILLWSPAYAERRTYLAGPLCQSLAAGEHYRVRFHYKLFTRQQYACGGLSVAFDNGAGYRFNRIKERAPAAVYTVNGLIADTGWQQAEFVYKASGTEALIVMGNFLPDNKTLCRKIHPREKPWQYVYCLIDELSVVGLNSTDSCPRPLLQPANFIPAMPSDTHRASYILRKVFFEHNSFKLLASSYPQINELAGYLTENGKLKAEVTGHTDSTGTGEFNLWLSEQRALAVVNALIERGINSSRLSHRGKGETVPIESNDTETGRALNRRVEVSFIY